MSERRKREMKLYPEQLKRIRELLDLEDGAGNEDPENEGEMND